MSIPDICLKNNYLKIAWVQRIIKSQNSWNIMIHKYVPVNLHILWHLNIMIQKYVPVNLHILWHLNMDIADATVITADIPNQFMKEVIQAWSQYNFYIPANIHQIRNQVIWLNTHVRVDNRTLFLRALYTANILYIHQFFDEIDLLSAQNLQLKYGLNIIFLTYYGIISVIPQRWKIEIKEHGVLDTLFVHTPLLNMQKRDHICKTVYSDLIQHTYGGTIARGCRKWNDYHPGGLQMEVWKNSFTLMYTTLQCTKMLLVQFKSLHFITATREKRFVWKIVDSDICSFCNEAIETLPHILIECEPVKVFWKELKYWLSLKSGIFPQPTVSEIITGFQNPDLVMFNVMYLLAKCYLCRCSTSMNCPCMRVFKTF